ncbi:LPXTG cell wall anchor domain-containing protein [Lacticaseibacillus daqingensis]|uniref:LPXTG cell wall anchor domain-containing protein n=1 Tax=Lacticaseibacillus daqingensis TaxID=2486014 RepID=UPI000F794A0A|nr:LPXTG cell wall anchor domain-containing protein [Lacticaseibacillus daqingensis]
MKDRNGAKKLYKAHKTWLAAGVVAASLFSIQVLGQPTAHVGAEEVAETASTTVPVSINYVVQGTQATVGSFDLQAQVGQSYDDLKAEVTANLPAGYTLVNESRLNTNDDGFVAGQTYTKTYFVTATGESATKTITIHYVDRATNATTTKTFVVAQQGDVPRATVEASAPAGYKTLVGLATYDDATKAYTVPIYNVADTQQKAADAVDQLVAAVDEATKTITIHYLDEASGNVTVKTFVVPQDGAVPLETVEASAPAGFKAVLALTKYDDVTKVYTVPIYDIASPKIITVHFVDQATQQTTTRTFTVTGALTGVPMSEIEASVPTGYKVVQELATYDRATNTYTIPIYNDAVSKTITVIFVDEATNEKTTHTFTVTGDLTGIPMSAVEAKLPAGYKMRTENATHDAATNTYTIPIYKASVPETTVETPAETPVETPSNTANKTTTPTGTTQAKHLPQTGDATNMAASGLGVLAVVGALFGLAGERRKRA